MQRKWPAVLVYYSVYNPKLLFGSSLGLTSTNLFRVRIHHFWCLFHLKSFTVWLKSLSKMIHRADVYFKPKKGMKLIYSVYKLSQRLILSIMYRTFCIALIHGADTPSVQVLEIRESWQNHWSIQEFAFRWHLASLNQYKSC